ncbi:hypothetical protein PC114_g9484 [Phytophthora cactorum]|uniref:Uncharacterized protein n=1 Tax=Phytophthora cactorum TaxID=29920 RepID=A0A8T1DVL2_9STRA|nr:hypothetical protein PC114_g9484 [Phytophthora cactorum]KAG2943849.1 hypothetical protein PC117_g9303 [Phytophthora cactorum]
MRGPGQMQAPAWTAGEGRDDGLESDDGCDGSDDGRSDATCGPKERGEERVKNNGSNNSERVNKQDEGVKSNDIDKLKYEEPAQRDAVQMIAYSEDLHV